MSKLTKNGASTVRKIGWILIGIAAICVAQSSLWNLVYLYIAMWGVNCTKAREHD